MEAHECPWIDAGNSQCAEDKCKEEDIAFECCKYRGPKFAGNIDWAVRARRAVASVRLLHPALAAHPSRAGRLSGRPC